jgi:hypothetical protein
VNAGALKVFFDFVYLVALAAWVGSALLAAVVAGPALALLCGTEPGARLLRVVVPRYCLLGAVAAAVALPAAVAVPLCYPEMRGPWVGVQALLIIAAALMMLAMGNSLAPRLTAAAAAGPACEADFHRLARRAAVGNGAVLAIGLGLLLAMAARPVPVTQGIVEPTPLERVRRESQAGPSPATAPGAPAAPASSR